MKPNLLLAIALLYLVWQPPNKLYAQSISGLINQYARVTAMTTNSVTVSSASGFAIGDLVLLIQMDGDLNTAAGADAGNYEFNIIQSIVGNTFTFASIARTYNPTAQKVQLVKVPIYTDVSVDGELSAANYDSSTGTGGVLALYACGTLTLNADIETWGRGFRGANTTEMAIPAPATGDIVSQGEGIAPAYTNTSLGYGQSPAGGVGGGAGMQYPGGFGGFGGGGGGGVGGGGGGGGCPGGSGVAGYGGNAGFGTTSGMFGENGQNASGTGYFNSADNKIFMGGGGGYEAHKSPYGGGGDGGGIIIIVAAEIIGNGHIIKADGAESFHAGNCLTAPYEVQDHFGGGGGGQILLHSPIYTGNLLLSAQGGNTNSCMEVAGGGGGGGIWVSGALPANVSTDVSGGTAPNLAAGAPAGMQQRGGNGLVITSSLNIFIAGACNCPPVNCDDEFCFTIDSVNPLSCECMHIPAVFNCDDGDCTTTDGLDAATCQCTHTPNTFDCDDGDCLTVDVINPATCNCTHVPIVPECDDENCATTDTYNTSTCECEFTPLAIDCNDNDCNTADSYDPATCICVHTPIEPLNCDDGLCATTDSYAPATCTCLHAPVPPLDCDDGDCNTADTYNTNTCACEYAPITPNACDDGDCNTADSYDTNLCQCVHAPIAPPNCDDNNAATTDSYNSATCTCEHSSIPDLRITVLPTAFSPNNDGVNDTFGAFGNDDIATWSMTIYNRWGQKVFESNNMTERWDGNYQDMPQEIGVYVYSVTYTLNGSNETYHLHHNITLIR